MNVSTEGNLLFISDTQIPYHADKALEFVLYIKKHYKIKDENVFHVGDEVDSYWGSLFPKSPEAKHTAQQELKEMQNEMARWYSRLPQCKLAISNHGMRWAKKALSAEIPSELLRGYREVLQAPDSWKWADEWVITTKKTKIKMIHGMDYSGNQATRNMMTDHGISIVHGHLHSGANITYLTMKDGRKLFGMNTGCLIDAESFAFDYEKKNRFKPVLSIGVVCNEGLVPIIIPYE